MPLGSEDLGVFPKSSLALGAAQLKLTAHF